MADTSKRTRTTATPRQASAEKTKGAEEAKPTKAAARKGIELVAKIEKPKKAKAAATMPSKTTLKNEKVVAISQTEIVPREMIEQVAYELWLQRGRQHGGALEDWIRAEQELRGRAS